MLLFNLLKGLGIFCCFTKISTHKKIVKTSLRLQQWETYFLKLFFKKWKETHKLIKQNNLKFSFWRLYVEVKGRYLQFKIIFIVKVTLIKKKTLHCVQCMCTADPQQCVGFRKLQKCLVLPPYCTLLQKAWQNSGLTF